MKKIDPDAPMSRREFRLWMVELGYEINELSVPYIKKAELAEKCKNPYFHDLNSAIANAIERIAEGIWCMLKKDAKIYCKRRARR